MTSSAAGWLQSARAQGGVLAVSLCVLQAASAPAEPSLGVEALFHAAKRLAAVLPSGAAWPAINATPFGNCRAPMTWPAQATVPAERKPAPAASALTGLEAIALEFRKGALPQGFDGGFFDILRDATMLEMRDAGLRVLPLAALDEVRGRARLRIQFLVSGGTDGCRYRYAVLLSLVQAVRLSRDPSIEVETGTWTFYLAGDQPGHEADTLRVAVRRFLEEWRSANAQRRE